MSAKWLEAVAVLGGFFVVLPVLLFFGLRRLLHPLSARFKLRGGLVLPPGSSLLAIPEFVPAGFVSGIEILNDNTTPMEFVVGVLQKYASMDRKSSIRTMLIIHDKGGILLPFESPEIAYRVADSIAVDARNHNHQLICRSVSGG
jgi:ATP-dependent Clp protease adaptor protein ClpS